MPINIEVNGNEYTNFVSATVDIALDNMANAFDFTAVAPGEEFLPFKGREACRILVDGVLVLTGFIEGIDGSYAADSHTISISGRDKTGDFIDSSIGSLDPIKAPFTLKELIEKIISHIGADIKVVDNASPAPFNKAEDIAKPKTGDFAFSFVEEYAQKRQVLLTSDENGDIVITNSEATRSSGGFLHAIDDDENNILNASWSYRTESLFNKYIQKGQQDAVALSLSGATTNTGIIDQSGIAIDNNIRKGRQMAVVADKGFSNEQLKKRAEWSRRIRQARSTVYSCSVQGFRDTNNNLWKINQIVPVIDNFANISREMLINNITFSYSTAGSITTVGFVEKNAYKLQLQEPVPVGTDQDAFKL